MLMATASGAATDAIVRQSDSFSAFSPELAERPEQTLGFRSALISVRCVECSRFYRFTIWNSTILALIGTVQPLA